MTTYRMQSSPMIHTPGMVNWGVHYWHAPSDRKYLTNVFHKGWGVPKKAVQALLSGAVPFTVDAENAVIFTYEEN